jgi:hypothetical protein
MGAKLGPKAALGFVRKHGVVLMSAKGPVPRLTEAIAGVLIKGSWWGHADGHRIYAVMEKVTASEDVLVCRAVNGRITLIHRRLWPALVRVAARFEKAQLAEVRQVHTASGRHVSNDRPFPSWVPDPVRQAAAGLDDQNACALLGEWVPAASSTSVRGRARGEVTRTMRMR